VMEPTRHDEPVPGFLEGVRKLCNQAEAVLVVDEITAGWRLHHGGAHLKYGLQPDIAVFGKALGNGHPIAAVITTAEIAAAFNNGMEYFNSFGGNPVSCAIALSVLNVIEAENLQLNAFEVGNYFMSGLKKLKENFEVIGDVRGTGLFIGIELVKDIKTREPSPEMAKEIINKMKYNGILISSDGPYNNVLKLKPPMVFSRDDAELVINYLEQNFRKLN